MAPLLQISVGPSLLKRRTVLLSAGRDYQCSSKTTETTLSLSQLVDETVALIQPPTHACQCLSCSTKHGTDTYQIVIVGAGPSGLILALQLARAGVQCTLLDSGDAVDERPRAAHYMPCAVAEMRKAGVLDDVRAQGIIPGNICWRKLDHSILAEMRDSSQRSSPDALTVLPLGDLGKLLVEHAGRYPDLAIHWGHKAESFEETAQFVAVRGTKSNGETFEYSGDYLCGTDGGNSTIRKLLFGSKFEGKTWQTQIIATNVRGALWNDIDLLTVSGILPNGYYGPRRDELHHASRTLFHGRQNYS